MEPDWDAVQTMMTSSGWKSLRKECSGSYRHRQGLGWAWHPWQWGKQWEGIALVLEQSSGAHCGRRWCGPRTTSSTQGWRVRWPWPPRQWVSASSLAHRSWVYCRCNWPPCELQDVALLIFGLLLFIGLLGHLEHIICETLEPIAIMGLVLSLGWKMQIRSRKPSNSPGLGRYSLFRWDRSTLFMGRLSHPIFSQNRMLIVCVPRNQVYTHTVQKMDTKLRMSQYIIYLPNNVFTKD
jgi:hypothetical protein